MLKSRSNEMAMRRTAFEKWWGQHWGDNKPEDVWFAPNGKQYYMTYVQNIAWLAWDALSDIEPDQEKVIDTMSGIFSKPLGRK